jgi:UPF0716 protein FxsA
MTRTEKQTGRRLPIGRILLIAFIATPLIEIAVLIQVGGWLGLWPTLGLIVLTAIVGTWMLRRQGFAVLTRAQRQLEQATVPVAEVFEGICLVFAGALLLTPGFVTDAVGGALLLPSFRGWLYKALAPRFREAAMSGAGGAEGPDAGARRPGPVVEGEFEAVDLKDEAERPNEQSSGSPDRPMPPPRGGWDQQS